MTESTSILGVAVRDLNRLAVVTKTVAKHGFGGLVARSPIAAKAFGDAGLPKAASGEEEGSQAPTGERLRRLFEDLGPTWIKLGQILSMRRDLLPPDWIASLERLQDETPRVPFEAVREVVEAGLGRPLEELFASVEEEPIGTASIGQTHRARTIDGRDVVLKVQRPGIEGVMRGDLNLLYLSAKVLEQAIDEARLADVSGIVAEFEAALLSELNFTTELSSLVAMRQLLDPDRAVTIPAAFPELSCRTVLCMEFFAGKPVRALQAGSPEARHAAEEIVHAACKQVLVDGLYHGDPHPGNLLVDESGLLCMIDLGLVGRLTPEQRGDLVTLIVAAVAGDVSTIARVFLKIGTPTERVNLAEFKAEISRIRTKYLVVESFDDVDTTAFAEEFSAASHKFRIRLNRDYSVLVKAGATLEGVIRDLDADVSMVEIAQPYAERLLRERYSPARLLQEAVGGATGVGSLIRQLPGQLDQILHDFETGNVQVRAVTPQLDAIAPALQQLSARVALTAFSTSMTLCAGMLIVSATADRPLTWLIVAAVAAAALGWTITLWWHILGGGKAVKIGPMLKLIRRPPRD
jgi:ubiquinone biosynthesis protein